MMDMTIRHMEPAEAMYCFTQSQQISMQTGLIGYLRVDMDGNGTGFFSSFNTCRADLKTEAFQAEFDAVINALRFDQQYGGILTNRNALAAYCLRNAGARLDGEGKQFGIRVDTEQYAYMLRMNPRKGDNNLYCYCYLRRWLDRRIERAKRGIRFIDPNYKELFRIPDGDKVRIFSKTGESTDRICHYIDDTHMELGSGNDSSLYHICQFAERMQANGSTVVPLRSSLPELCYSNLLETGVVVILKRGETGYFPTKFPVTDPETAKELIMQCNRKLGVSPAQFEAMKAGSMFGFQAPVADPQNYDEQGQPLRSRQKDRRDAR